MYLKQVILNFIKGIFIGIGALLPGLSGGALAAIFGVYEPIINFASNLKQDFKKNIIFFIPIGLGGLSGVLLLSHALSYLLENYLPEVSVFFIGSMLGVFPSLVKQSGLYGRKKYHLVISITVAIMSFILINYMMNSVVGISIKDSFLTWIVSGGIIGLGVTFPGLSPSNFLMFFNLYQPLNTAISTLNLSIIIPVALGGIIIIMLTSRLVVFLLKISYATVYHVILGLVVTSTVMIFPKTLGNITIMIFCFITGILIGYLMSNIEKKLKM